MKPVRLIIAGAGSRGFGYANYALEHADDVQIVGVAEPRKFERELMASRHGIPPEQVFSSWDEMAARDCFADAVVIATQDSMHVEPAVQFAEKGYAILLEKPMAPNAADCIKIVEAVEKYNVIFGVCHVLRYTDYTQKIKQLLNEGAIGELVSIQHLEPVGFWHQAHSFVRGNWRNEAESSFMLLAKSCHDIDWIRYIVDSPFESVSSFGNLFYFRPEMAPAGAARRCVDCPESVESTCPYSALRIYLEPARQGCFEWPTNVITNEHTVSGIEAALRSGPYGRCVFSCDNDVVDHQVVSIKFRGGQTGSFTMTAFTEASNRKTRLFGTKGSLEGDGNVVRVYDFMKRQTDEVEVNKLAGTIAGGHGGGDVRIMESFVAALANQDPSRILSGPRETLDSHLAVFAAEQSRLQGRVVAVNL